MGELIPVFPQPMIHYCLFNGELIPENDARMPVADLGVRRGFGIFDFFRVFDGIPMYLDRHLDRFMKGSSDVGLDHEFRKNELRDQVYALIRANTPYQGLQGVRILLTGGVSSWVPENPNLVITLEPLSGYDPSMYQNGVTAITHSFKRELSHIKTISYMTAIMLAAEMKKHKAVDVLYHQNEEVFEFSRSNIFIVTDGNILTPRYQILNGITRELVLELAANKYSISEDNITPEQVFKADEVFMTSTIKRILPVVQIDGHIIGDGKPGPITRKLMNELNEFDLLEIQKNNHTAV